MICPIPNRDHVRTRTASGGDEKSDFSAVGQGRDPPKQLYPGSLTSAAPGAGKEANIPSTGLRWARAWGASAALLFMSLGVTLLLLGTAVASGPLTEGSPPVGPAALPRASGPISELPGTDWPTYLGQVTRNSANLGEIELSSSDAANLTLLWSYSIGVANPGDLQAEPVEVNDTVYVGGGNGIFYAINATTGAPIWQSPNLGTNPRCDYPDGITSSATVVGGEVYVGGGDGNFYALNQSTGKVDWKFLVGNPTKGYYNWASPLVLTSLGYVYIGVSSDCDHPLVDGGLDQVSLTTHGLVHFFSDLNTSEETECALNDSNPNGCGGSIWGSPSYDAATNTVWAATGNGYNLSVPEYGDSLMEWNATTLALINHWTIPNAEQETDGDFGTTPTLVNPPGGTPMVFVTDKNGWSYALDRANIAAGPIWQTRISSSRDTVTPDAYRGRSDLHRGARDIGEWNALQWFHPGLRPLGEQVALGGRTARSGPRGAGVRERPRGGRGGNGTRGPQLEHGENAVNYTAPGGLTRRSSPPPRYSHGIDLCREQ